MVLKALFIIIISGFMDIFTIIIALIVVLWLILAFLSGLAAMAALNYAIAWLVSRELASQKGKMAQAAGQEKRAIVKGGQMAIVTGIADTLKEEGDFKSKLPKIGAVLAENPDAAESLLNKILTYARFLK